MADVDMIAIYIFSTYNISVSDVLYIIMFTHEPRDRPPHTRTMAGAQHSTHVHAAHRAASTAAQPPHGVAI